MKIYLLSFIIPAMLLLSACTVTAPFVNLVVGSGRPVTRTFNLSDFTSVSLANSFQGDITRGDSFGVEITADDNLFDYLRVTKTGSTLKVELDPLHHYSLRPNALQAKVTLPTLTGLTVSGASHATLSGFKSAQDLDLNVSGASGVSGNIESGMVRINASGSSQVRLEGTGQQGSLEASGASQLFLNSFGLNSAGVNLSGASSAEVNVQSKLDYDLSGASHLTYQGAPAIGSSQTSGASSAYRQ